MYLFHSPCNNWLWIGLFPLHEPVLHADPLHLSSRRFLLTGVVIFVRRSGIEMLPLDIEG